MNFFNKNCLFSKTQYLPHIFKTRHSSYALVLIGNIFCPVNKSDYNIGVVRTFYKL